METGQAKTKPCRPAIALSAVARELEQEVTYPCCVCGGGVPDSPILGSAGGRMDGVDAVPVLPWSPAARYCLPVHTAVRLTLHWRCGRTDGNTGCCAQSRTLTRDRESVLLERQAGESCPTSVPLQGVNLASDCKGRSEQASNSRLERLSADFLRLRHPMFTRKRPHSRALAPLHTVCTHCGRTNPTSGRRVPTSYQHIGKPSSSAIRSVFFANPRYLTLL